jgi:hypothetical protein
MPANQNPKSNHLPELAGAIDLVTGTLIVDTGLRNVQSFTVSLAQTPTAAEAIVAGALADPTPGGHQKLTLMVMAVDGVTPGVAAAKVSWTALGK